MVYLVNLKFYLRASFIGSILDVEKRNLREAGKWIKAHGEAIFNTSYWFVTPQDGDYLRFTQTPEAFYIITLDRPNNTIRIHKPIPYIDGDRVVVVGGVKTGTIVPSRSLDDGSVELTMSEEIRGADRYAWVFKIDFLKVDFLDER